MNLLASYFLGANSVSGFVSHYKHFCAGQDDFLYIIKGCPGSGKSTFMKRVAQWAEDEKLDAEIVRCSGDPSSLDGVYLPKLHIGYVDGTAPHALEPEIVGLTGTYLDFAQYLDLERLNERKAELTRLSRNYRAGYSDAYALLRPLIKAKYLPPSGICRFRHAVTCEGLSVLPAPSEPQLVTEKELQGLLSDKTLIRYLHPIFTDEVIGLWDAGRGIYYEAPLHIPDCTEAQNALKRAKSLHDRLESVYRPCVQFSRLDELFSRHKENILKKALSEQKK